MKINRLAPLLPLALAACASAPAGDFPSLARRPAETPAPEPVYTPKPVLPADVALATRIAGLLADARKGDTAFSGAIAEGERRIAAASGAPGGSEAWIAAQQALSGIETARGPSVDALAVVDSLLVARLDDVAAGKAEGGESELRAAQTEIGDIVEKQNGRLDSLKRRIRP